MQVIASYAANLLEWLNTYTFPEECRFVESAHAERIARHFYDEMIRHGTTTAVAYCSVHKTSADAYFAEAMRRNMRMVGGKVMMDRHAPDGLLEETIESLAASERLCAKWHGAASGRLRYVFTPRFAPTSSFELLRGAAVLADDAGAWIQSHLAETLEENARVRALFPDFPDYAALLEAAGMLTPRTILAHAIHVSEDECRRLAASATKIAHCPTSNFFLKSGRMPVERIEAAGIVYGLGTDVGAGTSMSLFTEMRHADYAQYGRTIEPARAFALATIEGAAVLGLEHEIGNFESGKFADFCVIDITGIDPTYALSSLDTDEVLSLLMYRGDSRAIESTWVAGGKLNVDAL
jgi:guanine deaminase